MSIVEFKERYRSPIHKLLPFFERSRDAWKKKCRTTKLAVKRLKNQRDKLQRSREQWKELAEQRGRELEQLRQELSAQKL